MGSSGMPTALPAMTPKKCVKEPSAVVPKEARVGFFFSHSTYSLRSFTPMVGDTQKAVCTVPASVMGAMSTIGSNGTEGMVSLCTIVADGT
jgi:hypothetical protein